MLKSEWLTMSLIKGWLTYIFVAFAFFLLFGGTASIANDFYSGYDVPVWRAVAYGGQNGNFLFDHKGPYFHWMNMLGLALSYNKWGIFAVSVVLLALTTALIDRILHLFGTSGRNRIFTLLVFYSVLIATSAEGVSVEEKSLVFQFLPLYLYIRFVQGGQGRFPFAWTLTMGVCFGVLTFIRLNNVCVNIAILLALTWSYAIKKEYLEWAKHVLVFIAGLIVACLPVVVCFGLYGTLDQVIHATFLYNFCYNAKYVACDIRLMLHNFNCIWPISVVLIYMGWRYKQLFGKDYVVLAVALSLLILGAYIKGKGFQHYYMIMAPSFVLTAAFVSKVVRCFSWSTMLMLFPLASFMVLVMKSGATMYYLSTSVSINILQHLPLLCDTEYVQRIVKLYSEIKTEGNAIVGLIPEEERNDVYFTGPLTLECAEIYSHRHIIPAGKYFYMQDTHISHDSTVKVEINDFLAGHSPKWIVSVACAEDGYIKDVLMEYDKVYTTNNGAVNLYHLVALDK